MEEEQNWTRRLPVYLLLDCSGSMAGDPIHAMEVGVETLVSELRDDPISLETVWLSLITFDDHADQVVPLTDIHDFKAPSLKAGGTTALGDALNLLIECLDEDIFRSSENHKSDWRPMTFIFTDGEPTDEWSEAIATLRKKNMTTIIACGAGVEVHNETLEQLGEKVVRLHDTQPGTLSAFMEWVSVCVTMTSKSLGTTADISGIYPDLPENTGVTITIG